MGVTAAIVLGVAAVASAGIGAYSANEAGNAAQGAAATASKQFRDAASKASGRLKKYEKMLSNPGQVIGQTLAYNNAFLGDAQAFSKRVNTFNTDELHRMLNTSLPGYQGIINRALKNTSAWVKGQVPDDVSDFVENRAAEKSQRFGQDAGTVFQRALSARDLGLTSMGLMQQGENSLQKWIGTARTYLTPEMTTPMNFLLTPERYTNIALAGANIASQRANFELQGANNATNAYLQGEQAKIEADQQMWASIAQGIESAAGAYAGYKMNAAGTPTGYVNGGQYQAGATAPSGTGWTPVFGTSAGAGAGSGAMQNYLNFMGKS